MQVYLLRNYFEKIKFQNILLLLFKSNASFYAKEMLIKVILPLKLFNSKNVILNKVQKLFH
jgi:hypothetical protein